MQLNFWPDDFVSQAVLIALAIASVYIWAVIIKKALGWFRMMQVINEFKRYVKGMPALKKLLVQDSCVHFQIYSKLELLYSNRIQELERDERGKKVIEYALLEFEIEQESSLNILSIIGSISPFVGLFGTVFGIMHSLQAMGSSNSSSIQTVAPGISQALFATAVGLCVAIPAAIATHLFYAQIEKVQKDSELFAMYLINRFEQKGE